IYQCVGTDDDDEFFDHILLSQAHKSFVIDLLIGTHAVSKKLDHQDDQDENTVDPIYIESTLFLFIVFAIVVFHLLLFVFVFGDHGITPQTFQVIKFTGFAKKNMYDGGEIIQGKDRKSTRLNSSHVKISYAVF